MLATRPLEELKETLQKKEKTEIDIMVKPSQKLKTILKESHELKQILPSQRSQVIST